MDDILMNHIFAKLSFKTILRCRCVCKEWLRILKHPDFAKIHLRHQLLDNNNQKILLGPIVYNQSPRILFADMHINKKSGMIHEQINAFTGVFCSVDPTDSQEENQAVWLPGFDLLRRGLALKSVLGTCNGIICAEVAVSAETTVRESFIKNRRLFFGNPSTGVYKILPDRLPGPAFIAGFGYVSSTDDYKFVRVDYFDRIIRIYSLKSNSWSTTATSNEFLILTDKDGNNIGCSFDVSIYWLVPEKKVMVEFDLKDEEFKEALPLPCSTKTLSAKVVARGSLSVISVIKDEVEIWSMQKKNSSCNWTKQMKVKIPGDLGCSCRLNITELHPLYVMKDDEEKIFCCFRHHNNKRFFLDGNVFIRYAFLHPNSDMISEVLKISGINKFDFGHYTFHHQTPFINSFVSPC